jgi:hypothetical protein
MNPIGRKFRRLLCVTWLIPARAAAVYVPDIRANVAGSGETGVAATRYWGGRCLGR